MAVAKRNTWIIWTVGGLLATVFLGWYLYYRDLGTSKVAAKEPEQVNEEDIQPGKPTVQVESPKLGGAEKIAELPCSVQAYESAQLFAEVSGYLKTQDVDIGFKVNRGQVLATIDVPDLVKTVQRNKAAWDQTQARVTQMKAQVKVAKANVKAARAAEVQAKAAAKSAEAWVKFRTLQLKRTRALSKDKVLEEALLEEATERYEATLETERSAIAGIVTSEALRLAKEAYVEKAEADVLTVIAEAEVAKAEWEKSEIMVNFATIKSPYKGIITQRSQFPGEFVRAAPGGSSAHLPLLTVECTDRMRVVVQVPDQDVPFVDPGDKAYVMLDALPNEKLEGTISRDARSEDPLTRLMRVEIDLVNKSGKIRRGMYGKAIIILEKSNDPMTIPVASLVGPVAKNRGQVYLVREGNKVVLVPVELGTRHGTRIGVRGGLTLLDQVVRNPGASLTDGAIVEVIDTKSVSSMNAN